MFVKISSKRVFKLTKIKGFRIICNAMCWLHLSMHLTVSHNNNDDISTALQEIPHDFHKQIKVKLIKYARRDKRVISCKLHVVECKESGKYTCGWKGCGLGRHFSFNGNPISWVNSLTFYMTNMMLVKGIKNIISQVFWILNI